eukprot:TRINITY_DN773035_c0_g1_i1.p2 TRINITY_DN773035_c0_g1~~TRINITY_DN773035_c0_g1_i1.p2  ORF type:complete len:190 (+),score=43.37 TRINITY_DN773035_c0_g1_i1:60-572(+)
MSGVKRRTGYRKNVTNDYLDSFPEPNETQSVVVVNGTRGSNIFEVTTETGEVSLALLPTKFRKLIWVKRGSFLIVSTPTGDYKCSSGRIGKVRYIIDSILTDDQVKHLKEKNMFPKCFFEKEKADTIESDIVIMESDSEDDLPENTNHFRYVDSSEEESSEDDSSEESDY